MDNKSILPNIGCMLNRPPSAQAAVRGSDKYPDIRGRVLFYQCAGGVMVRAEIAGLPHADGDCKAPIFGFHIHSGESCTGNKADPFADTNGHFNPMDCPHPYHAGDMPPLFGVNGRAVSVFLTDRFTVDDIVGKTLIIHSRPDDFTTQPSGNSGVKAACGVIKAL